MVGSGGGDEGGWGRNSFRAVRSLSMKNSTGFSFCFSLLSSTQKRSEFLFVCNLLQLNLRSYNEELRQHLIEARKELEQNNRELALKKQVFIFSCLLILEWPVLLGLSES